MTHYAEAALWTILALAPNHRVQGYDPTTNTFYTMEMYSRDSESVWAEPEFGIDIRKWGKEQPYQQHCIRYKRSPFSPLQKLRRVEESYDSWGQLIETPDDMAP
jgi:hypothetical protein